ncbi:hypothetical protein O181_013379 [Austropuccinia psidii MF-1]|uniref:Uncharacterized protein n=1 Tax=Austropuccinia psidii MF-1 TaxID=1389203 RepID=A0A9Q3GNT0_9BASI|nr:hypothetical protein [Austropuccinia psidii MF-1]
MRPKGAKVAVYQPPNHKWAHLSHFWRQIPISPEMAKRPSGPQVGHCSAHGLWQPPEATSSAPIKDSPQGQWETFPSSRIQEWCIYCIIYHYAPSLLRNPIVTFSAPNYVIPNQVSNQSSILKKDVSAIQSGNSLGVTRRPLEDPNHLALLELGCEFS